MIGMTYTGDDGYDAENEAKLAALYGGACALCTSEGHLADTCAFRFDCHVCQEDGHEYDPNGDDEVAQWYGIDPQACRVAARGSIARARGSYDYLRIQGYPAGDLETDPVYAAYLAAR